MLKTVGDVWGKSAVTPAVGHPLC